LLDERAVGGFRYAQRRLGLTARPAFPELAQLAPDNRNQSPQVALGERIPRACFERARGKILAHGA